MYLNDLMLSIDIVTTLVAVFALIKLSWYSDAKYKSQRYPDVYVEPNYFPWWYVWSTRY